MNNMEEEELKKIFKLKEELKVAEQALETNIQQRDKAQKVVREIQEKINKNRESISNIKREKRESIIKIENQ